MGKKKKQQKASPKKQAAREAVSAREKPAGRTERKKPPEQRKPAGPNWLLTGLAGAGMVLAAYLVLTSWLGHPPIYCREGSSCDLVQRSRWGTFMSLPTAFWGFLAYMALVYIGTRVRNPLSQWKAAWTVSAAGLGYSVYLMIISLLAIKAACAYCIISLTIMAAIFGVVTIQRPREVPGFSFASFARQTVIITALIVGGMHMHYSGIFDPGAGPEDPYLKGLAEHLARDKAVLYGAYW